MLSADFIAMLRCPESGQPLRAATVEELDRARFAEGLAREDGQVVYPILEGIPMLMVEHGMKIPAAEK